MEDAELESRLANGERWIRLNEMQAAIATSLGAEDVTRPANTNTDGLTRKQRRQIARQNLGCSRFEDLVRGGPRERSAIRHN